MNQIRQYHFHEGDDIRPHFETIESKPYLLKHGAKATAAHRHSFYQLIWFQKSGIHYIDYESYAHPANVLFFIDKGQVHKFCDASENDGYLFHFNDTFLNRFEFDHDNWIIYRIFNELNTPFIEMDAGSLAKFSEILKILQEEEQAKEIHYKEQLYFLFRVLITLAQRLKLGQSEKQWSQSPDMDKAIQFKQMVEQTLHDPHEVSFYAVQMSMTVKQLSALVRKIFGVSPGQMIHEKRAVEAKRLLSNTDKSIKEVAYFLGFQQSTYFTKFFKQHVGMTPKEFRAVNF